MKQALPIGPALALAFAAASAAGCWGSALDLHDAGPAGDTGRAIGSNAVTSPPSIGEGIELPTNVHVTWQGRPDTTLTFSWRTFAQSGYTPKVWLAPTYMCSFIDGELQLPAGPANLFTGAGETYLAESGDTKAWFVEATGLAPDTDYFYRVGTWDFADAAAGEVLGPRLGPLRRVHTGLPHGSHEPFTFAVSGDNQGALTDLAAHIEEIAETPAAFWLLTGDMTSTPTQPNWDLWFATAAPILEGAVTMPVPGNHETSYGTFYGQFALPIEPDLAPELAEHAWSFDYGNANVDGDMEALAAWLEADLTAAEADPDIDWKIAFFHYPAYSASSHGCTSRVLEHWSPVLEAHGVDLVFSGHDHDYERTFRISGGALAPPGFGVTYIVAGGFFTSLYNAGADWWTAYSQKIDDYVVVEVDGHNLHLTARDPNDQTVFDEVFLTKGGDILPGP
jgi:hypothetical protein